MEALRSAPTGKCSSSKKRGSFLLFDEGYLTPRGWALQLDWGSHLSAKVEVPLSAPTGKCS
ncbi:hypothetical protein BSG1_09041 [Bacillus sp. SG-1]|nr:hypothetical protein BSG1_09041 [Bacillus sp. SG-1]